MAHPENVDVLDENGNPTGELITHTGSNLAGLWHAGVHVALYTKDRRVLLQQRSKAIMFYPGLWELGIGGVVGAGESIQDAAVRETFEEVGAHVQNLEYVTRWKYNHHLPTQGMHSKVFLYSYIAEFDPSHLKLQKSEVQGVRLAPLNDVHNVLFNHKGLPQVHLLPYEGYYRQMLTAIEGRLSHSNWLPSADTINPEVKEEVHEQI
ncbi:MAG TPA: NUDIX hydrolase [Candidatus Saccharimonadales bacterium]|nr:NUDIX hydrolase [Candidatus Saccharimonadales bacterium]